MKVSIITPYFKSEKYIFNTVRSVIKQTFSSWELIIIDDENSKISKNILSKIKSKSKKIKIVTNKKNIGAGLSRNVGINYSKGKYIAFLDSDDIWEKQKLEKQIQFMEKKKYLVSFTSYVAFNLNKNKLYSVNAPSILNYQDLIKACPICCSTVIVHKSIISKYKFKKIITKEDYELWLRISKKYFFYGLSGHFTRLIIRPNSLSGNQLNKIFNAFKIYNYFNRNSIIKSLFYVLRLYINAFKKKYL